MQHIVRFPSVMKLAPLNREWSANRKKKQKISFIPKYEQRIECKERNKNKGYTAQLHQLKYIY